MPDSDADSHSSVAPSGAGGTAEARTCAADIVSRFGLDRTSLVVEIDSGDGSLLRHFVARHILALGIEPAVTMARAARRVGVPTRVGVFDSAAARHLLADGFAADVVVATRVLAHAPGLDDVVLGISRLLKRDGAAVLELPRASLASTERLCGRHGLRVFDVTPVPANGSALRVFVQHVGGPHRGIIAGAPFRASMTPAPIHLG